MNDFKNKLLNELEDLKGSGKFVSINTLPFVLPGLEIEGVGEIPFPINEDTIQKIIQNAEESPFGLGMDTIYDDSVRKGWEIDGSKLSFNNPEWFKSLNKAIKKLKNELGIEDVEVEADLYKMLIYEEGSFFLKHKDTEKEKGMFGTLVVGLPSYYEGGEFEISFDGETIISDFSKDKSKFEINYTAFYADCDHEVKPVKSGYRIVLTYNLIQRDLKQNLASISPSSESVSVISKIIKEQKEYAKTKPFIVLLDHQYTPDSFALTTLKLNDRYKVNVLLKVAENLGFYSNLCLVTSFQSGEPLDYYDEDSTEIGEIYDEYLAIEHWIDSKAPKLGKLNFEEDDLIASFKLHEDDPIEAENTGYMGNWGPDVEHWYHYGAVIIWSKDMNAHGLLSTNKNNFLEWVDYFNTVGKASEIENNAIEHIILNSDLLRSERNYLEKESNVEPVAKWLLNKGKIELLLNLNESTIESFVMDLSLEYWMSLFKALNKNEKQSILAKSNLFNTKELIAKWLKIVNGLNEKDLLKEFNSPFSSFPKIIKESYASKKVRLTKEGLLELFRLESNLISEEKWEENDFDYLKNVDYVNPTYLHSQLFPALVECESSSELFKDLLLFWESYLLEVKSNMPLAPKDWTRDVPKNPRNKKVWDVLIPFLQSPIEEVLEIRQRKDIREEFENEVRNSKVDLSMTTITKGSPHILRLQKNQKSYHTKETIWNTNMKWLKKLSLKKDKLG